MADDLDTFLTTAPGTPAPAAEPEPAPEPVAAEPATPEPEADEETPIPEAGTIPVSVLQAERAKRQDWKSRYVKAETEAATIKTQLAEIKAQLEAAQKAPPPVAAPVATTPPPALPDPTQDPVAYYEARLFNQKLDDSEARLRDKLGDEVVDATIEGFKRLVAANPALGAELKAQRDPYKWVHTQVERQKALDEIGTDPAAYQERMKEKWLAEYAAAQAAQAPDDGGITPVTRPAAPTVVLPKSLTSARSAAPRAAPAFTGPQPLDELFPGV
jgi:hypothetical protein